MLVWRQAKTTFYSLYLNYKIMKIYFSVQLLWMIKSCRLILNKTPLPMKLSVLFLICSLSMTYAAESYAQKTMISLEVRNETVGTVLEKLKKESGFDFFFNNKHVDLKRIVSVSANNNNIFKILDQIFAGTNVKYSVLEKKIILSTEIVQGIQQEQNKVTGIVKDNAGIPIVGATIMEKGSTNGTVSDLDGNFSLQMNSQGTILISYIGYITQEIKVDKNDKLIITLEEDTETLDEVVVVGYGAIQKRSVSTAISTVKGGKISEMPTSNISQSLVGMSSGITLQQISGEPGAAPAIRVRGAGSINSGNDPLFVIDGYPTTDAELFNNINPADIADIQILKDAASSAIYGSKAGNGVIIVTTKQGQTGKPKVSFSTQVCNDLVCFYSCFLGMDCEKDFPCRKNGLEEMQIPAEAEIQTEQPSLFFSGIQLLRPVPQRKIR